MIRRLGAFSCTLLRPSSGLITGSQRLLSEKSGKLPKRVTSSSASASAVPGARRAAMPVAVSEAMPSADVRAVAPPAPAEDIFENEKIPAELKSLKKLSSTLGASAESTLVFNAVTGRMTSETSPSVLCLKSIGFGINEKRHVYVERPDELRDFARRMREGTATLPPNWPITVIRAIGVTLRNRQIADPAEAIQQMIQVRVNNLAHNRYASEMNAVGNSESADESSGHDLGNEGSIEVNEEQSHVIDLALKGHFLYIGGSAGTGKTVLLRVLGRRLQAQRLRIAMTATTGVAGCHIGGSTFHHAFGVSATGEFLRKSSLLDYDAIIIDEVSMFSKKLFEDFDRVLREEAGTPDLPFGGVQVILCGDFLQLGVINESSIIYSRLFQDNFVKIRLSTQVRQESHPVFAEALQKMRVGIIPETLLQSVGQLPPGTMAESAVNLLPTNKEVQVANEKELARLPGDAVTFTPETGITSLRCDATATLLLRTRSDFNEEGFSKHVRSLLQATLDLPRASLLCLYRVYEDGHAMRVILPPGESAAWRDAMRERFLEVAGLINDFDLGATVMEILPSGDGLHTPASEEYLQKLMAKHPIAQPATFKKGCRVLLRSNFSSRLVNGSVGTVVDFVECTLDNIPSFLRGDRVDNSVERYRIFCMTECGMSVPLLPVVKFHSGDTIVVPPWEFNVGGCPVTHYYSLSSVALPLSLAYAFTVHKVQGLTLVGRVHLELSRMWPCDHLLYVAMSRVRNPEQLTVSAFQRSMVVANKDCVAFDQKLRTSKELQSTDEFPVASWKRCNDTIYHMRRRGASFSQLLRGVTAPLQGEAAAAAPQKGSLEHSVLVARRMRKLIKHTERMAKMQKKRKKGQGGAVPQEDVSDNGKNNSNINDDLMVEHLL